MRRLAAAALLALVLGVGTASADTFAVVPDTPDNFVVVPDGPVALPSAEIPNEPGSILLPPGVWEAPFLPSRELSYEELQALWARAGAAYGIPWQVLAAINKIESNFGRNMGPSSAGAVGWMQFIPDTWLRWGTDGDGDGIVDPWDPEDAVFAAARYLAASGGRPGHLPRRVLLQPRPVVRERGARTGLALRRRRRRRLHARQAGGQARGGTDCGRGDEQGAARGGVGGSRPAVTPRGARRARRRCRTSCSPTGSSWRRRRSRSARRAPQRTPRWNGSGPS